MDVVLPGLPELRELRATMLPRSLMVDEVLPELLELMATMLSDVVLPELPVRLELLATLLLMSLVVDKALPELLELLATLLLDVPRVAVALSAAIASAATRARSWRTALWRR